MMQSDTKSRSTASPRGSVLIVEDSATQRELLKYTLERNGFAVTVSADGQDALARLRAFTPTLIISDILMPEMDGFTLCRRIRAEPRLRQTPVILLTALNDSKDVLRGLECGADNFIVKPFRESDLLARIEHILAASKEPEPEPAAPPVQIVFDGETFRVAAARRLILNFLLAAYQAAVDKSAQLASAQEALQASNADLERKVQERTAKLEQAYKSLESFSYSIAHDLRAPLRTIQGFTSLLLNEYGPVYNETARDYSRRVIEAAERMDQLIHDLLSFGRISQAEFPLSSVSLESVLLNTLPQFADEIQQRHAEVKVDYPLPAVQANQTLLEQVLVNLISNALKFAKDHTPPRIHIWSEVLPQGVRLYIEDNGIGIAPVHLDRIFRVFERLHDTKKYPGTGIGLVIVRKGIERMGGQVGVESTLDVGSKFWIELPPPEDQPGLRLTSSRSVAAGVERS